MIDIGTVNEQLKDKRLKAVSASIDSERGVYEVRLDFEQGHFLELAPDGLGLRVSGGQEYVGPPR